MLLTNGFIITLDDKKPILEKGAIYYKDGVIEEIGDSEKLCRKYIKRKNHDS